MVDIDDLLPSFADELEKIAARQSFSQKVDTHLTSERKDWDSFEKNLHSPRFAAEVKRHPLADEKLKDYVTANNQYARSKDVVMSIPSRTQGRLYPIKTLPGGRLGCGCKDWQYKHSWRGTDCDHISAAKAGLKAGQ